MKSWFSVIFKHDPEKELRNLVDWPLTCWNFRKQHRSCGLLYDLDSYSKHGRVAQLTGGAKTDVRAMMIRFPSNRAVHCGWTAACSL